MKKFLILAVLCLLASASPVSAQLIIRNSGHAEIGTNPIVNDIDTVTTLKIFGDSILGSAGRITFGDSAYVYIGEKGIDNTNKLCLYGKKGVYMSIAQPNVPTTIAYYDTDVDDNFTFNYDVTVPTMYMLSDERYKENIEPVGEVLPSLRNLEPVTYNLKSRKSDGTMRHSANNGSERYGFLAQNVQEVFPELVHTDGNGYLSVDYIGLIPILVQSINELRAELTELKGEKQEDTPFMAGQQAAQSELEASLGAAKLYQNAPNPWSSETVIRYSLPQNVAKADIYIYDMQGAQLKCIPAQGRGESQVTLTARDLKAGMYLYALVADGALVDSKQMILTK